MNFLKGRAVFCLSSARNDANLGGGTMFRWMAAAMLGAALFAASCTNNAPVEPTAPVPGEAAKPQPPASPVPLAAAQSPTNSPLPLRPSEPVVFPGSGVFVNPALPPKPVAQTSANSEGAGAFNFVNPDVRDVLREILGDQLHLSYTMDPRPQPPTPAQPGGPLPRDAVLPML